MSARWRERTCIRSIATGLLPIHESLVRKIVAELNDFDNLYYEICNEPYFGGVTMAWQQRMIDVIVDAETALPHRHSISLNVANGAQKVEEAPAAVSILNFHYASPPDAVRMNYALNRAIGDNETGFKGTETRTTGWKDGSSSWQAGVSTATWDNHPVRGGSRGRQLPVSAKPAGRRQRGVSAGK